MANRADEIRREIQRRKKSHTGQASAYTNKTNLARKNVSHYEDRYDDPSSDNQGPKGLFNKDIFIFKMLVSAVLVLLVAIMFKTNNPYTTKGRTFVSKVMHAELQFTAISDWYEKKFGKEFALFPTKTNTQKASATNENPDYAVPASGKVMTPFSNDKRGVLIETSEKSTVEAFNGGTVIFAGNKKDLGKTVIIQHADLTESWYGKLDKINVSLYDKVSSGKNVGIVSEASDGKKGEFYFAIKEGKTFIDPVQVIKFD